MNITTFLNNHDNCYRCDVIEKLIYEFNLSREKAKKIYKDWRINYLKEYTPRNQLDSRIGSKNKKWSKEECERIIQFRENGMKNNQIAKLLGVGHKSISHAISRYYEKYRGC